MPPTVQRLTVVDGAEIFVGVRHSPEHVVGRVQQDRVRRAPSDSSGATVMWSLCPWVHTTATTLPSADGHDDRARVVGGVEDHDVGVVTDEPDVVVDFPTAAVEFEGAVCDDA